MACVITLVVFLLMTTVSGFCPDGCGCDEEKLTVTCIRAKLEVMPISLNPSIQTLILKYNEFRSVDASFNFYSELVKVDLSHNHLVSIPSRAFKSQRKLTDLRMRGNKISEIDQDTFSGLGMLETLDLRTNLIETLEEGSFQTMSDLKQLDLGNNRINQIDDSAFVGLSELVILYLDDNQLESVPTKALSSLPNLAELHLSRNNFKTVNDGAFIHLSLLSLLDLSGNKMWHMEEHSLKGLKALKTLKIKDNQLVKVPTKSFENTKNLEQLSIGQNKFEVIEQNSFGPLSKLKVIDISGCENLNKIESKAFSTNFDLERVNIHSNRRLTEIHPQSFPSALNLRHVNFANNALTKVSPTLVPWQQLKSAQLTGNPWNCDCSAMFLRDVIISLVNNSSQVRVTRCWSPPAQRDQDILTLDLPECHYVQSPNVSKAMPAISTTVIVAVAISAAIVFAALSLLWLHYRKDVSAGLNRWSNRKTRTPVKTKDILCYDEEKEPRYVSSYTGLQTLPSHYILNEPNVFNTYHPNNSNNIYHEIQQPQQPQTFVRHDQYFITLARQDLRQAQSTPMSEL